MNKSVIFTILFALMFIGAIYLSAKQRGWKETLVHLGLTFFVGFVLACFFNLLDYLIP